MADDDGGRRVRRRADAVERAAVAPDPLVVPPGRDERAGGSLRSTLRAVLRPRWRSVVGWSVGALAAALALLLVLPVPRPGTVLAVDAGPAIATMRRLADFTVYVPAPLPAGWQVDSARVQSTSHGMQLGLGFRSPDGGYVGLEDVRHDVPAGYVPSVSGGGVAQGFIELDGVWWVYYRDGRRGQETLVHFGVVSTIVITGTTHLPELEALATSLHVRPDES